MGREGKFFLKGIATVATESRSRQRNPALRERYLEVCHSKKNSNAAQLLNNYFPASDTKKEVLTRLTLLPTAAALINVYETRNLV
jgi:hypothetical protein